MSDPHTPPPAAADPERLALLDAYGLSAGASDPAFDGVVLLARTLCAARAALVSIVCDDRQWFLARSGFGPTQTPLSQSVCAHALEISGLLVIPDLRVDPRTRDNTLVTGKPHLQFYAGASLRTPEGHALGSLCVLDRVARPAGLSLEQGEGLQALAKLVMAQLELQRALRVRDARIEQLTAAAADP